MRQQWLDGLAIGASSLCLVHCLMLPALLIALPALAGILALPDSFHFWALVAAVPTSMIAVGIGYRHHRRLLPVVLATTGLLSLIAAEMLFHDIAAEAWLAVAGSLQLAIAHALNIVGTRH